MRLGKLQKRQREHIAAHPYLARDYSRENPYETGNKKRALTRQTASRTAYMAQPDVKAAIAEAGVSRKRVGELVKAGGNGFGLMAKAERDKVLRTAINQAKAEKARDLRVADAAAMAVHDDKQAKHIAGSRQHEQYVANLKRKGSVIGYVIGDNGEHIPTTRFTIHYADGDVHIVPAKPKEAQQ